MHVALDTRARIGTMKNMGERLPLFRSFRMTGFDGEEQFVHAPDGIDMRSGAFVGVRHHHGIPSWRGAAPGSAYGGRCATYGRAPVRCSPAGIASVRHE